MLLKEYIKELNDLVANNPKLLNREVYYASDDEGNSFQKVSYTPSVQYANGDSYYVETQSEKDEEFNIPIILLN